MEKPPKEENLYKLSEERKVYREALEDENIPDSILQEAGKGLKETYSEKEKSWQTDENNKGWFGRTKDKPLRDKQKVELENGVDVDAIFESLGDEALKYKEIEDLFDKLADISDFEMKRLREIKTDPYAKKAHERLLKLEKRKG